VLTATLYQGNPDRNHNLWNIKWEIYTQYIGAAGMLLHRAPEFMPGYKWGSCYYIFSCMCMFCRSLFVLLYFAWSLRCLFFFALRHTHTTKDIVTRTPLITRDELGCSRRVGSFFSTSDTRRVNLVSNPVLSHEWGKDRWNISVVICFTFVLLYFAWSLRCLFFFALRILITPLTFLSF
jgi:hypothetical protein